MKPGETVREGDDFLVPFDESGVGLHFFRVRETDSTMRALVAPVRLEGRGRLLAPIGVNLFTLVDRERLARALCERLAGDTRGNPEDLSDWKDSVERAFASVINEQTRPEPLLNLASMPAPPDEGDLIEPVLARNQVNVILADQGSGKSYVGLFFAACISAGLVTALPEPLRLLKEGPVLYYDAETDWEAQRRRLERICAALRLRRLPDIHYRNLRPPLAQHGAAIRADVAKLGAIFAVFDSLTFLAGGDLNSTEVSVPTMNAIGDAGQGCTKLAMAHHGKAGRGEDARPSALGSAAFEFKARSIWLVRRMSEPGSDHIEQAWVWNKGNDARPHPGFGLRLSFNVTNTEARFSGLSAAESTWVGKYTGTAREKIIRALMESDGRATTPELAAATGLDVRTIQRTAPAMPELRLLEGGGQGRGKAATWGLHRSHVAFPEHRNGADEAPNKSDTPIDSNYVAFPPNGEKRQSDMSEKRHVAFDPDTRARHTPEPGSGMGEDLLDLPF